MKMIRAILMYGSKCRIIDAIKKLTPKLLITSDFKLAEISSHEHDLIHIYDNPLILEKNIDLIIPQNINYIVIDLQGFTSLSNGLALNIARRIVGILKGLCVVRGIKLVILSPARARIGRSIVPAFPVHDVNDEIINLNNTA
ncbi:MAG: hypothetical protein QXY40_02780 [Candidatus Methanomethylicia archaeon]